MPIRVFSQSEVSDSRLIAFVESTISWIALCGMAIFWGYFIPLSIFSLSVPTGGDMGSHFFPLYTLVNVALPHWDLRVWNPGNLGGEPHHLHYFPLPYIIMAVLSSILPLEIAFKFAVVLPVFLFPLSVYLALKGMNFRFPLPILGAASSLCMLFNEAYSAWGGNVTSMLAGQFAHLYAFCCFGFGVAAIGKEIRSKSFPLLSSIWFSLTALSHAYIFIGVPFILLSFCCFYPYGVIAQRFKCICISGISSVLLSSWYLVPMLHNQPWTTAFPIVWGTQFLSRDIFSPVLWPCLALTLGAVVWAIGRSLYVHSCRPLLWPAFWSLPTLFYTAAFFFFPKLGLVDVRAVPQILYFLSISGGLCAGAVLKTLGRKASCILAPLVIVGTVYWVGQHITVINSWMVWNFSGWIGKPLYPELKGLTAELSGSFSDPRVIYEHSNTSEQAGTVRVFEMLPFFANRSTLESVYLQASILAPIAFHLQAKLSQNPSCPLRQYKCEPRGLSGVLQWLKLMAVGDLILISDASLEEARRIPFLKEVGRYGPWYHFKLTEPVSYVSVATQMPEYTDSKNWKDEFYQWYKNYDGNQSPIIARQWSSGPTDLTDSVLVDNPADCNAEVKVDFNKINLKTECPGKLHYLAFAWHPTWAASTGDPLYLTSPGFIGIVPSAKNVQLNFGQTWIWPLSTAVSLIAFLVLSCVYVVRQIRSKG